MTFKHNAFYRVEEPLLVLKHRGTCETNDFNGASMLLRLVKEAVLAQPGDEIHALVGGCFLVDIEGKVSEFSLRTRAAAFERAHGGFTRDQDILASLAKAGRLIEIEGPARKVNYRENPAEEEFERLHNEVIRTSHSPLFRHLKLAFPEVMSTIRGHETARVTISDFGEAREVVVTARDAKELLWSITCAELDGRITLNTGKKFNEQTGVVGAISDSLSADRLGTRHEEMLFLKPGDVGVLENIDSHLAMAIEEYLYPTTKPAP